MTTTNNKQATEFFNSITYKDSANNQAAEFFKPRKSEAGGYESGIEVTTLSGEWVAEIGLWFDNRRRLVDYDGIYDLGEFPSAIHAIRKGGFTVPKDMTD